MSKVLRRSSMAELSDDLIPETIARLPLKYAVQCSLLNKNFLHRISDAGFRRRLSSSSRISSTNILCYISSNSLTRITREISSDRISQVSTTPFLELSTLASCNGVVLLQFSDSCYVFNPFTSEIMLVNYPLLDHSEVDLAVDLDAQNFQFKLVTVAIKSTSSSKQSVVTFSVVVPSSSCVVVKSRVEFVCRISSAHRRTRPVYAHGCLHWLGQDGNKIIVFDVEKEKARIINGPFKENDPIIHVDDAKFLENWFRIFSSWLGFVDGSLQLVYSLTEEIVIQSHNYLTDEWQVKHKINPNTCYPLIASFFDGQRLFVELVKIGENGAVVMHDILSNKWEKTRIIQATCRGGKPSFLSFFPTLAKVSDKYLHNYITEFLSTRGLLGSFNIQR